MTSYIKEESWRRELADECGKEYFASLMKFIDEAYSEAVVYPPREKVFEAFELTPFNKVKVVILGQDPYHGSGQAHGLAFSVPGGVAFPPSLRNIFKELAGEYPGHVPQSSPDGVLSSWAHQGVLLLNTTLTVEEGKPLSHHGKGWEEFTDAVVQKLSEKRSNLVFMLWGGAAREKGKKIDRTRHLVLESAHPSPLSAYRGFFGNNHFRLVNDYLCAHSLSPVIW